MALGTERGQPQVWPPRESSACGHHRLEHRWPSWVRGSVTWQTGTEAWELKVRGHTEVSSNLPPTVRSGPVANKVAHPPPATSTHG